MIVFYYSVKCKYVTICSVFVLYTICSVFVLYEIKMENQNRLSRIGKNILFGISNPSIESPDSLNPLLHRLF